MPELEKVGCSFPSSPSIILEDSIKIVSVQYCNKEMNCGIIFGFHQICRLLLPLQREFKIEWHIPLIPVSYNAWEPRGDGELQMEA